MEKTKGNELSLKSLTNELTSVTQWYDLGIKIGVPSHVLDIIEKDHPRDTVRCRSEMLKKWQQQGQNCSWTTIRDALHTMGMHHLANKIEKSTVISGETVQMLGNRNELTMKVKFAILMSLTRNRLQEKLQRNEFEIEDFRMVVTAVFGAAGECILESSSLSKIFLAITTNGLWDYWNYYALESIVELYCNDAEMVRMVEEYKKDLVGFQASTKIIEWVQNHEQEIEEIIDYDLEHSRPPAKWNPKYYRVLRIKLKENVTEHTLTYVQNLWKSLANRCLLPDLTVLLDKICSGSIVIYWLVPTKAVQTLIERGRQCTDFFREHQIVHVEVDGVCIYDSATEEEVGVPAAAVLPQIGETSYTILKEGLIKAAATLTSAISDLLAAMKGGETTQTGAASERLTQELVTAGTLSAGTQVSTWLSPPPPPPPAVTKPPQLPVIKPDPDDHPPVIKPDPDDHPPVIKPDPDDHPPAIEPDPDDHPPTIKPDPDDHPPAIKPEHDKSGAAVTKPPQLPVIKPDPDDHPPVIKPDLDDHRPTIKPDPEDHPPVIKPDLDDRPPAIKPDLDDHPPTIKPDLDDHPPTIKPDPDDHRPTIKPDPDDHRPTIKPDLDNHRPAIKPDPDDHPPAIKPDLDDHPPAIKPDLDDHPPAIKPDLDDHPPAIKPEPGAGLINICVPPHVAHFVLICNLRRILKPDPYALSKMKLAMKTLQGKESDEFPAIDPCVYQNATTCDEFFGAMAPYWQCFVDNDLLEMVIKSTGNDDAVRTMNEYLESKNSQREIPMRQDFPDLTVHVKEPPQQQHVCPKTLPPNCAPIIANVAVTKMTCGMLDRIKNVVSSVIDTSREAMCYFGAFNDSVIVWHASVKMAPRIKAVQLSPDDKRKLLQYAITELTCEDKTLFAATEYEQRELVESRVMVESGVMPQAMVEVESGASGGAEAEAVFDSGCRVRMINRDEDLERVLGDAGDRLVVVDFSADWCGPSMMMHPIFDELSNQHSNAVFCRVDSDRCMCSVLKYNVNAYPTFAFFRNKDELHKFSGADEEQLEEKLKFFVEGGVSSISVPGQTRLLQIDWSRSECLNESDSHPFTNALTSGNEYLESDCDEQLIVALAFTAPVKLHSIQIVGPPDGRAPKTVKLFINQLRTLDFDAAEQRRPLQEFVLTEKDIKQHSILPLAFVKFQNVHSLTLFIKDNQGNEETTVVTHIGLFGTPLEA